MAKIGAADDLTVKNAEAPRAILGIIRIAKVLSFALKRSVEAQRRPE
jgi:hypothetical protein